ncbi:hypothetical protein P4S95_18085 [Aneurinibacillus aneurinilyticus]|uniref:hypothetical protein n=1 Tax=Aneurinibacillus aneurinilyticus TaxID=1391 RepID=UPI002E1C57EE|nr:hypothetical protein [Aneurinibacillus aneurinilyticus]
MDILSAMGYAIASYIAVYAIITLIVAELIFSYAFRQWRKGQKEYNRMAAANSERREEMQERFRERRNKRKK